MVNKMVRLLRLYWTRTSNACFLLPATGRNDEEG